MRPAIIAFSHRRPRGTVTDAGLLLDFQQTYTRVARKPQNFCHLLQQERITVVYCPCFPPANAVRKGEIH